MLYSHPFCECGEDNRGALTIRRKKKEPREFVITEYQPLSHVPSRHLMSTDNSYQSLSTYNGYGRTKPPDVPYVTTRRFLGDVVPTSPIRKQAQPGEVTRLRSQSLHATDGDFSPFCVSLKSRLLQLTLLEPHHKPGNGPNA